MSASNASARLRAVFGEPWIGPLLALAIVYAFFAIFGASAFTSWVNFEVMARQTVVVAIVSVGMTFVIATGGVDLSVGSIVALVSVVIARALRSGSSPTAAVLAGFGAGLACGLLNGALVTGVRITPFLATLGTMSAVRGAAKGFANEQKIDAKAQGLDELMSTVPPGSPWLLPAGVWAIVVATIAGAVVLARTRFGRHVIAVGSNERAARLCGVPVAGVRLATYALTGALAGVAGVMQFAKLTVGDPTDSAGLELDVIAAVVIGGASLSGGRGSIAGSLLGAMLMTVIKSGCTGMGIANWIQQILTGGIIVTAVALDGVRQKQGRARSA